MTPIELKQNFEDQIKKVNEQITQLESDLDKAKEYKFKLLGGLETLELLNQEESPEETEDN
jgi:uncharacterized coiled-coil protein SlyX